MKKLLDTIISSIIFLAILLVVYFVHVRFFNVNVVFYAAIADAIIATAFSAAIIFIFKYFSYLSGYEKFLIILIWMLSGYAFAISVPTVIDRSLSFYILEKLQQRGGGIKLDRMSDVFSQEYMREHRLVDVRLTEQSQSGTIEIKNNCVRLTEKGKKIALFSRYFRKNLLPKHRLLMGTYTDVLTDPFSNSIAMLDYSC